MKKIFFALTLLVGLLLPLAPRAQAETEVSLNLFYDNLSDEGNWIDVGDYGYCFQPNVAASDSNWRPYADGYWAYTDAGWTWVSYEDFGWATYHYGRWTQLEDYGWVWVPGLEWAGAWVSWRTGGDYVGWAPLPPAVEPVYEGRAITGHVDVEFDIGPTYYNFVDVRYIGEPVLRQRLIEPSRNVTIINNTVNVTNITYNNTTVINSGPNFEQVNRYSVRKVKRMELQRETTIASLNLQGGARRNFNQVNGNQLRVVAPQLQKSTQKLAPKQVKATVKTPTIEHGWKNVPDKAKLQAQMKNEDSKNVPPPTIQPQQGRRAEAAAAEPKGVQPNDNKNAAPANENNGAGERDQQAARAARQNRANAQQSDANQANESANAPAAENARAARQAKRAEKADQANSAHNAENADNAQADQRAKRKAAPAQTADESKTYEQKQPPADQADRRDLQPSPRDQAERRAARRAQREGAPKAEAAPDQTDNQNNGQQDRSQQQERRKARQENRAEQQPQPSQARSREPRQNNAPADDSQRPQRTERSQPADQPDRAQGQERQQAVREERAQRREQRQNEGPQNAPAERKKKKTAPEETPAQPQP